MTKKHDSQASPQADGVGYCRPPRRTQFQPGRSGNPKGRPKGSRSVGDILHDIMSQRISVNENGKSRRVAAIEVLLLRLRNNALGSNDKAIKLLLALMDRYDGSSEKGVSIEDLRAEDQAILAHYARELGVDTFDSSRQPDSRGTDDSATANDE